MTMAIKLKLVLAVTLLAHALGCTPPPPKAAGEHADASTQALAAAIPVSPGDPARGNVDALVTVVVFGDYECPHCRRANTMMAELAEAYGPDKLRVVWKHFPVDAESTARTAAELSIGVRELGGDAAFWDFHGTVYGDPQTGPVERRVAMAIAEARESANLDLETLARTAQTRGRAKVEADLALGTSLGVRALPSLFINGVFLEGIGTRAELTQVIDDEMKQADQLIVEKVEPSQVYRRRVTENLAAAATPSAGASTLAGEDVDDGIDPLEDKVYRVPIAGSPTAGNPAALITLVEFADFECTYCAGAAKTVKAVQERYGEKLRVVFKNSPLPFHERATPAANLALEIRAQKGDAAFFKAQETLFAANGALDDALFERVARDAGVSVNDATRAMREQRYAKEIENDQMLADDVGATGTPYFYVNGKRIKGARSLARFIRVIDAELASAEARVKAGTPPDQLYASIVNGAEGPEPLTRVELPPVSKTAPARGPKDASVVVEIFADFQCGFCRVHAERMEELEQAFPGKLRFVFHNFPLSGHARALPAAIAALEARRQKGDEAFFKMHDLLFADQNGLDDRALLAKATKLGLDVKQVEVELAGKRYEKVLAAEAELAEKLGVSGTPTTFINGYRVGGAASLVKFKKAVRQALADGAAQKPASTAKTKAK